MTAAFGAIALAAIAGTVPPPGSWPEGCRFAARCQFAVAACDEPFEPTTAHTDGSVRCIRTADLQSGHVEWRSEARGAELTVGEHA